MMDEAGAERRGLPAGRGGAGRQDPYDILVRERWPGGSESSVECCSQRAFRERRLAVNIPREPALSLPGLHCAGQVMAGRGGAQLTRPTLVLQAAAGVEMTWVIADYTASASGELTVHKGQQVEVLDARLDATGASSDWCLVRMPAGSSSGHDSGPAPEGLVPLSVLKQPPQGLKTTTSATSTSPSRRLTALPQDDAGKPLR